MKKIRGISILKAIITCTCLFIVALQLSAEYETMQGSFTIPGSFVITIMAMLILMLLNWWLEVLRWKISIDSFEPFNLKSAFIDVMGGIAMNWVLPFTSGDFFVRLIGKDNKKASTVAVLINRGIMLSITTLLGVYSLSFLGPISLKLNLQMLAGILVVASILIYLILKREYVKELFTGLSFLLVIKILTLSIVRYLVFTIQFFVLIKLFNPGLANDLLIGGIGWIFFIRSVIPSLLGGLGIRETSAIFFFREYVEPVSMILFPVFLLWVINTVLPSLIGALFIWKLRFKIAG